MNRESERAAFESLKGAWQSMPPFDVFCAGWRAARASSPNAAGAEGVTCGHQWTWADGKCADCGAFAQQPTATTGMTLAERIAHVGGHVTEAGCVEFGSAMAVDALIQHVLRDLGPTLVDHAQRCDTPSFCSSVRRAAANDAAPPPPAPASAPVGLTENARKLIEAAAECIAEAVNYEQDGFDSPPQPASQWDYNADQLAYALRALLKEENHAD
ncbi:hypothetical protein LGN12_30800 [Burkholderia multivorans]|uniref:hypothetical protein n=1 Tax=Burkholderia multivorans TaxID=87883 RepID=UPI001C252882|nr:hypothetical protein [Burkholderia multivorans]MBU9563064.1 hypothetical protein [Burkholderia multivorans]MCA8251534.1 hypothetical protein [Burkholderia multivorans]